MKKQGSKRGQIDQRNIIQIIGATLVFISSAYLANTDSFNSLLAQYIDKEWFVVITAILSYGAKKILTDYSSSK